MEYSTVIFSRRILSHGSMLFCLLLLSLSVFAQRGDMGKIIGYVQDEDGKPLSGATVCIPGTAHSTETGKDGRYILVVTEGAYDIIGSAVGYLAERRAIVLKRGESQRERFVLHIDPNTTIDQVIVTGKSAIQEVRETPFNVVALDAKSQYNSTLNLGNLLDRASGVKVRESGGVGSDMNITLNGFTGRNIRVFMDGVPMQGMGSAFQLNNIPVNIAERIEVYKGVVPIEFGADALGGVINIVTNRSQNTTLDASYSHGSFNTHRSNLSLNHTFKSGVSLQVNAFQNYSDNNYKVKTVYREFSPIDPDEAEDSPWQNGSTWSADSGWFRRFHDTYRNETIMARAGIVGKSWADQLTLALTLGQVHQDVQHGAEMRYVYGERTAWSKSVLPSFVYDKRNLIVDGLSVRVTGNYNYEKAGSVDTSLYRYSWTGERMKLEDLRGQSNSFGEASYGLAEFSNTNASATANIGYRASPSHSIAFNNVVTDFVRRPDLVSIEATLFPDLPTAADSMSRRSVSNVMGLEYRYTWEKKWNTNLFAKHYLNSVWGPNEMDPSSGESGVYRHNQTSSKMGYGMASTYFFPSLQLKASIEKAYRLPNERELFGDEILEEGNSTLRPEESNNFNIGFTLNKELNNSDYSLYMDWSGYYRDTRDFIQTILGMQGDQLNGNAVFRRQNHGRVTRLGTDVETRVYYKNVATLGGTLTYMDIRDRTRFADATANRENLNYGYRMPNLPYFFYTVDASYYLHDLFGNGNTLNLNYALNFVEQMYLNSYSLGSASSRAVIPSQLYSDVTATYNMKNGKYNVSLEARNLEGAMVYDNFSLQKPGRRFNVTFRYFFIKRNQG